MDEIQQSTEQIRRSALYTQNDRPQPVIKMYSVRGLEYLLMTISLWVGAISLAALLISLVTGKTSFDDLSAPVAALVTALIPFSALFLRLKKAELLDPSLRFEPSKRRSSQVTQVATFLVMLGSFGAMLYSLLRATGGDTVGLGKIVGAEAVVFLVAGAVFVYYWFDEHKLAGGK